MLKTYLLEVIKAIPPIKPRELAWILDSPLYNKGGNAKEMTKLYRVIMETAPDFSEELLQKERVYSKVFSDKEMTSRKLDKLMADLNKTLRLYLLTKNYLSEKNDAQQQLDWAIWLRENSMVERSKQLLAKLKAAQSEISVESLDYFRLNFLLAQEEHERESKFNKAKGDLGVPDFVSALDLFFLNYRVSLINRYLLQRTVTSLPGLATPNIEIEANTEKSILLKISLKINEFLDKQSPESKVVLDLVEELTNNESRLSFNTIVECYTFIRSICSILINGGHQDFLPILHRLYLNNIQNGYLLADGNITPGLYLNLVAIAIRANDHEWAKKVTEEYRASILGGDEDQFLYNLNKSQCLFAEGCFDEALECLPQTSSNAHYHFYVRILELKIYYEQKSVLLPYKTDALRKYIERTAPKTLAAGYQSMIINFLNILLQLSQTPFKNKARSALLLKRIAEKKLISERAWLIEKAKELG